MVRKSAVLLAGAGLGCVCLILYLCLGRSNTDIASALTGQVQPVTKSSQTSDNAIKVVPSGFEQTVRAKVQVSLVPDAEIPRFSASFRESFPALVSQSMQGDHRASCRIAHSISSCAVLFSNPARQKALADLGLSNNTILDRQNPRNQSESFKEILQSEPERGQAIINSRNRREHLCQGLDLGELSAIKPWELHLKAARSGNVFSMWSFAINGPLGVLPEEFARNEDAKIQYKLHAPAVLLEGARANSPKALAAIARAYSGLPDVDRTTSLAAYKLAEVNHLSALNFAYVYRNLPVEAKRNQTFAQYRNQEVIDTMEKSLTLEQIESAKEWARQFAASHRETDKIDKHKLVHVDDSSVSAITLCY